VQAAFRLLTLSASALMPRRLFRPGIDAESYIMNRIHKKKGHTRMLNLNLSIPEDMLLALKLGPEALALELKLAAHVKLFVEKLSYIMEVKQ